MNVVSKGFFICCVSSHTHTHTQVLSCLVFIVRDRVCVDAVLELMTRVKMKSYYRAAITAVRDDTTHSSHSLLTQHSKLNTDALK